MSITHNNLHKRVTPILGAKLTRRDQRGIALLLTIFGLLLLTGLAMAMMFSSDAETAISVNYRDSQVATYAAYSAVEEARDRIHPVFGDLGQSFLNYAPTNTPDQGTATGYTNGGYVLYILNPNTVNKETWASIAPWSTTVNGSNNPYFDTELCHENMFPGLVTPGAAGTACSGVSAVPPGGCTNINGGGNSWCRYYDNSANATPWQLADTNGNPIPLDYKWVRVTMKEDWNTPVYIPKFGSANGTQACWDGIYQDQKPPNYNPATCEPNTTNSVLALNLGSGGSGYLTAPAVTITGGGGSGATGTAQISPSASDGIASVVITNGGSGYTSAPTVAISSGNATFTSVVPSQAITSVTMNTTNSNYCYQLTPTPVTPTVTFTTTPGTNTITNATATVTMNNSAGCIAAVSNPGKQCTNTTPGKVYAMTGSPSGGGSGFTASVVFGNNHKISSITITNVGKSYSGGSATVGIKDDSGSTCSFASTFTLGRQVSNVTIASGNGGAYMSLPTGTFGGTAPAAPSSPTLPTLAVVPNPWPAGTVTAANITSPGSGYTPGTHYPLTFTGGGGTGAAGYAVGGGTYVVSGLTVTNGGTGYTTNPTVTLSGGGGTGATGTATIGAGVANTSYGQIYLLTSLAVTKTGSKSMVQMEAGARPPFALNIGGAITLAGPEPAANFTSPNSNNMTVSGTDANSCNQQPVNGKPAIGVWDSASQTNVISDLGKPQNYTGAGGTPSVLNVYTSLGGADVTPDGLYNYMENLATAAQSNSTYYSGTVTTLPPTTTGSVSFVNGNLTLSGNPSGSGILVVTGALTFSGNFNWNGIVLVVGQGQVTHNGGGNMFIDGAIYVSQIMQTGAAFSQINELSSMSQGSPQFIWNGGGSNQVQYDHCLSDALLQKYDTKPSNLPLQVLSVRTLQF